MTAYIIARVKVKDADRMKQYGAAAGPTVAAHKGTFVLRGKFAGALIGSAEPHNTAIIQFPDLAAVEGWFNSPEYQALGPLRDSACEMEFLTYEVPA